MRNFFVLIIAVLSGCTGSHQILRPGNAPVKLDSTMGVYISVPRDGRYGHRTYYGSGVNAASAMLVAFSNYCNSVDSGHQYQSFDTALNHARDGGYGYLVYSTILEWEDRASEWSGIPDRASIKIVIFDAKSGKTIDTAIIKSKSSTIASSGEHPQDLLPKPVEEYVLELY